jgi:hypothetical protein
MVSISMPVCSVICFIATRYKKHAENYLAVVKLADGRDRPLISAMATAAAEAFTTPDSPVFGGRTLDRSGGRCRRN